LPDPGLFNSLGGLGLNLFAGASTCLYFIPFRFFLAWFTLSYGDSPTSEQFAEAGSVANRIFYPFFFLRWSGGEKDFSDG
jgi:hypothetical protein